MKRRYVYIIMILLAVLLLTPLHLGYSLGDMPFKLIGISPWTNGKDGFYLPFILLLILIIWGIKGVVQSYKPEHQKVLRRTAIACIVLVLFFPMVVEKATFVIKRNTTGLASIDYSKKKSNCSYQTEEKQVKANCSFTLYNYGNLANISIKPVLKDNFDDIQFEPIEISISPQSRVTLGMAFFGKQGNGTGYSGGSSNNMDVIIALP